MTSEELTKAYLKMRSLAEEKGIDLDKYLEERGYKNSWSQYQIMISERLGMIVYPDHDVDLCLCTFQHGLIGLTPVEEKIFIREGLRILKIIERDLIQNHNNYA